MVRLAGNWNALQVGEVGCWGYIPTSFRKALQQFGFSSSTLAQPLTSNFVSFQMTQVGIDAYQSIAVFQVFFSLRFHLPLPALHTHTPCVQVGLLVILKNMHFLKRKRTILRDFRHFFVKKTLSGLGVRVVVDYAKPFQTVFLAKSRGPKFRDTVPLTAYVYSKSYY